MRNVTITLEESVAEWVRVWAARHDTSVSRFLADLVRERMNREEGYTAAMRDYLSRDPWRRKSRSRYPTREAIHDRSGLR